MMVAYPKQECDAYLEALSDRRGSFTSFGQERITGFVVGRCFSVTHHAGHEFNRRITNERSNAIGYVKKTEQGTEVHYIRLKGWTTPQALLGLFCLYFVMTLVIGCVTATGGPTLPIIGWCSLISLGLAVVHGLVTAVMDSLTEAGAQGTVAITSLMEDPENPFLYA